MPFLPSNDPVRRAALGIASIAFGMLMRELADRRRAAAQQPQPATPAPPAPAPPADPEPAPQAVPKIVIRPERPLHPRPQPRPADPRRIKQRQLRPRRPEPPAREGGLMTRTVTWGGWTFYLLARLSLVTVATLLLDISSTTQVRSYFYLALLPGIGALLIPYGKPRQYRNPIEGPGALTVCSAVLAIAIWPWYFYGSATAPLNPVTIISTESFSLPSRALNHGCVSLLDTQQHTWYIDQRALGSIKDNQIVLYQTTFGWISDKQATQSPSPFFGVPHLNEAAYSLTPRGSRSTAVCMVYDGSGGH